MDPSGLGFFSFLKKIFAKIVKALKAALAAFVVAFVSSGSKLQNRAKGSSKGVCFGFGFPHQNLANPPMEPQRGSDSRERRWRVESLYHLELSGSGTGP